MEIFEKHFKSANMAKNAKKEASVKRKVIAKKKKKHAFKAANGKRSKKVCNLIEIQNPFFWKEKVSVVKKWENTWDFFRISIRDLEYINSKQQQQQQQQQQQFKNRLAHARGLCRWVPTLSKEKKLLLNATFKTILKRNTFVGKKKK